MIGTSPSGILGPSAGNTGFSSAAVAKNRDAKTSLCRGEAEAPGESLKQMTVQVKAKRPAARCRRWWRAIIGRNLKGVYRAGFQPLATIGDKKTQAFDLGC
jgi:hypothetical protein